MKSMKFKIISICILGLLIGTSVPSLAYSNNLNRQTQDDEKEAIDTIPKDADWYYKPDNYTELVGWYQELEANYPDYIEIFNANEMYGTEQATGGYDLYYVRITNESLGFHKPEVMFLGGIHGDETVGTIGMYWFLDWFTRKAFTDEPCDEYSKEWLNWLVDNREIYFIITHNPYGFDHGPQRYDGNGWDLNREGDYDWADEGDVPSIWASENGQTLYRFINNHTMRVGCDIHGGVRMLIYPWASTYHSVSGTSPISGETYEGAPPDFYFFDAAGLRVGSYMGDGGGDEPLDESNIGTIDELIYYTVHGGLSPWGYAADVVSNPQEDPYVEDEIFGNYPGAGILWYSPEMSETKNPAESTFGNDTIDGWGWEIRRFILHQTDIAQPYVRWQSGTIETDITVTTLDPIQLNWQVNGSLVVDHTFIQYGSDPDPIQNYDYTTSDYDAFEGDYVGGTGWDNAYDGTTEGITYTENMTLTPGEYYFVAKAQVDQVYGSVLSPGTYGDNPYLRLVKERTNASYYESLDGSDGIEEIIGQTWWYSPIIHITIGNMQPTAHYTWEDADGTGTGTTINFNASASTAENITLYEWDWDTNGTYDYSDTDPLASYDYGDSNSHGCTLRITDNLSQTDIFTDTVQANVIIDVNQSVFDRGFPIRHAVDGDWAGAQNFTPTLNHVSKVELYLRTFGTPEFDLVVELHLDDPQGDLLDTLTFTPAEVPSSWTWFELDFEDQYVGIGSDVFVVVPPAPSGVTTSFGYEWGYAFGNQYDVGSFWFTRDGGGLWRDLPTMYEFVFKTYGYG